MTATAAPDLLATIVAATRRSVEVRAAARPLRMLERETRRAPQGQAFLTALKVKLPEVSDVRLSRRLTDSASVLVADREAMTAHYERLMRKLGRVEEESKRVLEVNPTHPAVAALKAAFDKDPTDPRVESFGRLLYEQAVIAEGSKLKDPAAFARRLNDLMAKSLGG